MPRDVDFKFSIDVARGLAIIDYTEYFDRSIGSQLCKVALAFTAIEAGRYIHGFENNTKVSYDAEQCMITSHFELPFDKAPAVAVAIASEISFRSLVQLGLSFVDALRRMQDLFRQTADVLKDLEGFYGQSINVSQLQAQPNAVLKVASNPALMGKVMKMLSIFSELPDKVENKPLGELISELKPKIDELTSITREVQTALSR